MGAPFATPADFALAQTLPQGGTVVGGSGTIQQTSSTQLTINQASQNLSIDWQSFSVGAGHIVRFNQPNSSALALNRVIGPDPSQIFGQIQANGRVVIMNPAGIFFGPSAMVDVNALVATTARTSQADFLAGTLNFSLAAGDPNARVVNEGAINVAQGGFAVLAAAAVRNTGTVIAQGGTVVLAGTPTFALDFHGDGLLKFAATGVVTQAPNGAAALVENTGTVSANGGRVLMTARAARDVINNVINTTGIVEARAARLENGEIVIDGGENGIVSVNGLVNASGNGADARGGNVTVLGEKVGLFESARVDVSGAAGGGQALIGGNYLGQGPEPNAKMVYMDARAVIDASATANGDGGRVILWSDLYTSFQGNIAARGGALGGNGGFVETSSKDNLQVQTGRVDVGAAMGRSGTWLLDPRNVTIANATVGGTLVANVFHPTADSATIDVAAITAALNVGTSVEITTGTTGAQAGNITVGTAIAKTAGGNAVLTLNAAGAIYVYNAISSTASSLRLNLWSGTNIEVTAAVTTNNGAITTAGTNGVGAAGGYFNNIAAINTGTANILLNHTGNIALDNTVNTSGIVALSTTASISQNVAITGSGSLVLGGTGPVTLLNSGNAFSSITLNRAAATSNVSLRTSITPNVKTSSIGTGQFTLTGQGFTQSGAITQAAGGGTVTIAGGTGTVTLSQANAWTGDLSASGSTVSVLAAQTLARAGLQTVGLTSTAGNVLVQGNLTKTNTGGANVSIQAPETAWFSNAGITSGGGSITIWGNAPGGSNSAGTNAGTAWGVYLNGAGAVLNSGAGNISIVGKGSTDTTGQHGIVMLSGAAIQSTSGTITLQGRGGDGTGAGSQGIIVGTGTIQTQTGTISMTGWGGTNSATAHGITVDTTSSIVATTGANITLNGTGANGGSGLNFTNTPTLNSGSGSLSLTSNGGLSLAAATLIAAGNTTLTGGAGAITATNANNQLTGTVAFSNSAGNVALSNAAGYSIVLGASTAAGALSVVSGGALTQTGALTVGGAASFTAGGAINLSNGANIFGGAVTSTSGGGGSIQYSAASLTLGTTNAAGNLIVTTTGGGIYQTGLLTVNGNLNASTTGGPLGLSYYNNVVAGSVSLTTTGAGFINWKQSNAMQIAGIASAGSLEIEVTSGSISQVGAITTSGDVTLNAANGNITLTNASNAFGGPLNLTATSGSASVTTAGALQIGAFNVANNLTVVAGAAVTQSGIINVGGITSLSGGTMTLTNVGNDFGTSLTVAGAGGTLDGSVASTAGSAALAVPGAVTALGTGFTFGGVPIPLAPPPAPVVTVTDTTTNQQIAQVIAAFLASVASSTTATNAGGSGNAVGAAAIVAPAALQAALAAVLEEAATQQNQQQSAEPGGAVLVTPATGPAPTAGAPQAPAVPGVFAVGTTITISTSGGATAVTITPPAGGGPPQVILPGLLNLNPPSIPSATQFGVPGVAGNFMQNAR